MTGMKASLSLPLLEVNRLRKFVQSMTECVGIKRRLVQVPVHTNAIDGRGLREKTVAVLEVQKSLHRAGRGKYNMLWKQGRAPELARLTESTGARAIRSRPGPFASRGGKE